ncbi:hypothetical protein Pmani_038000 [Petrolisthes manimaculis]|uniref:Uncharacterized protein n=1 Tax=Petrolisthes manimaculis TaxID=1843537 RepID=A0AAE1TKW0_9EUCA|nr:hypothetical protein Pmani_038000 [Petrolisthes manimaculis]
MSKALGRQGKQEVRLQRQRRSCIITTRLRRRYLFGRLGVSAWRQRSERRQKRQSREWMVGCNEMAGTAGNGWQDVVGWQVRQGMDGRHGREWMADVAEESGSGT